MSIRLLIIFFTLTFGQLKSQTLSTVFIDTVKIVVDGKTIYESNTTSLKFVPNNMGSSLTLFNDGIHKFIINFGHIESKKLNYISALSGEKFSINDSTYLSSLNSSSKYEACSEMNIHNISLKNWDSHNLNSSVNYEIRLAYRLCSFAPIDTTNYIYNYREGKWIGPDRDVEKVTVNYKNDKKHGVATAYYNDGTSFNVNFNNNIADNYGKGYWENYKDEHKLKFTYAIPNIVTRSCNSINAYNTESFYFSQVKMAKNTTKIKEKEILKHNNLSIYSEQKGILHDSIEYNIKGEFTAIINDSLIMRTDDIEVHDFYKKNTDSLHCFYKKTESGHVKVPIRDISKIYYTRDGWTTFGVRSTLLALASAFIVSPLISIEKSGFNIERFSKVSLISIGVIPVSISLAIAFSQKKFLLKPDKKSNKVWKIEYDAYE